jgi:hypothetical protein
MHVERPPTLWEPDALDEPFIRMLGEMIAAGLALGNELDDLVLNASNVVVEPGNEPHAVPHGEYVAITIVGPGNWESDASWTPNSEPAGLLKSVAYTFEPANAAYAYVRALGDSGSITVWVPRRS